MTHHPHLVYKPTNNNYYHLFHPLAQARKYSLGGDARRAVTVLALQISLSISLNPIKRHRYYTMFAYESKSKPQEYYNDMVAYEVNSKGLPRDEIHSRHTHKPMETKAPPSRTTAKHFAQAFSTSHTIFTIK